jgi:hypothetical protein
MQCKRVWVLCLFGWGTVFSSTPFHLILPFQQDEKRSDARRAGLALANASERNNADGRLSSCPKGAAQIRPCGVAVLDKGIWPLPTDCVLPWRIWAALKMQNKMKWSTSKVWGRSMTDSCGEEQRRQGRLVSAKRMPNLRFLRLSMAIGQIDCHIAPAYTVLIVDC